MQHRSFGQSLIDLSNFLWGAPLLILLFSGGLYFLLFSRLKPLFFIRHALAVLAGRYDNPDEPGQINHYQALSTALAGTVGMGNVSGVALAITMGGPGAIFWMWVSALLGMMTKFFTCTLAVMFRGYDSSGELQGGPMYFITEGLGQKWRPMAVFFAFFAMAGVSPMFQANQLTQAINDIVLVPNSIHESFSSNLIIGILITFIVSLVIFGGIKRIGKVTGNLVPLMVIIYVVTVLVILTGNADKIIPAFKLIIKDAFSADSVLGGSVGSIIIMGFRRAAFSNEAGIGTAPMAHGAAKTNEPVREGLVAMIGPFIDTIVVCSMTAFAILVTGVWIESPLEGISLTTAAFNTGLPVFGKYILIICITTFALTTLFAFPYYGTKAFAFIFGAEKGNYYKYIYVALISLGAVSSLDVVISVFDSAYALMAFPTMTGAVLLSPHVVREMKKYFKRLKEI